MLTYYARILDRHRLPVYPIVVYLTETSTPIETAYVSHVGNKHVITFDYDVIKVWELRSKMVFEKKLAGLYALAPLMPDANLDLCREKMIEAVEQNLISPDYYMCMATFASLKYPKEVVKNMIQDKLLKETPFYMDLREEAMEEGMEKGAESGIITILAARFGAVSDRLSKRVHSIRERNAKVLTELMKLAATVKDIGEFERKLDQMM